MILQHVEINNIRSIKKLKLDFPPTTMLFFGDIGSGKSSVLKAVEFALFGVLKSADLSGDSILRRGENNGFVELSFLLDGDNYKIKRGLSRNKEGKVSQTSGFLTINSRQTSFTPTDLRRKVLEALNYSVTRYERAQSIDLFRYTVYTPQESVKEILEANPEKRFEILKDIFGIEKYEVTLKNLSIVNDYLRDKLKEIDIRIKQFDGIEDILPQKEEAYKDQTIKISNLVKEGDRKQTEIEAIQKDYDKIKVSREEILKFIVEFESSDKTLKEASETKKNYIKELEAARKTVLTHEEEIKKIPSIKLNTKLTEEEINTQLSDVRKKSSTNEKKRAVVDQRINDINSLLEQGKCTLCGQKIHEEERFKRELDNAIAINNRLKKEKDHLTHEIENLEKILTEFHEFTNNKTKKELYEKLIETSKAQEMELQKKISELNKKIKISQKKIKEIFHKFNVFDSKNLRDLDIQIKNDLNSIEQKLKDLVSEKGDININLSSERKTLEFLEKEINEFKKNIGLKEMLTQKLKNLTDLRNWMKEEFPVLLRDIERQILISSAHQFNSYFKEWFQILAEESNIEVEISVDDFQPIINVNGYESPFQDLSGGEKSALSLAFRLGLKKIINERYQEVKTKDLLILDEPTDGFSQQQINKMQEIFDTLDTSQMIIISHERALDSFVTDVFHFEKKNHKTNVQREVF
jgi:exonuclease SbcC